MSVEPDPFPAALRKEMCVRRGPVAAELPDSMSLLGGLLDLREDEFLFRTPSGGARFHYRCGEGIMLDERGAEFAEEVRVYLNGTVYGAVAWLSGLVPLHASAVASEGRAIAFTAPSGGGKSTLAAALVQRGMAHVSDDTLVVDPRDGGVTAYPDTKPLKLWDDAFALATAERLDEIDILPGKFYASATRHEAPSLPLTDLIFLEFGHQLACEPIRGIDKARLLPGAFYRVEIHAALDDRDRHAHFMKSLTGNLRFWRFIRPRDPEAFSEGIDFLKKSLAGG